MRRVDGGDSDNHDEMNKSQDNQAEPGPNYTFFQIYARKGDAQGDKGDDIGEVLNNQF